MKANFIHSVITCAAVLAASSVMSSCNDLRNSIPDEPQKQEETVSTLNVNMSFSWEMTKTLPVTLSSSVRTEYTLYLDEECTTTISSGVIPADETVEISITVPISQEVIYLSYYKESGKVTRAISLTQTKAAVSIFLTDAVEKAFDADERMKGYVPSQNGKGTLMFEDLYPAIGDYDFNDVVVYYNIVHTKSLGYTSNTTDECEINFTVYSKGGSISSDFGLELTGIPASFASRYSTVTVDGETVSDALKTSGSDDAVFEFNTSGGKYDSSKLMSFPKKTISIKLSKDDMDDITGSAYFSSLWLQENFNWFIVANGKEIHLKGFKATALAPSQADDTFTSARNLVWGINVPKAIIPAKEKTDMLKAYPDFKKWVEDDSYRWYESCVEENLAWSESELSF